MADCSQASNKKQGKKGPKRASSSSRSSSSSIARWLVQLHTILHSNVNMGGDLPKAKEGSFVLKYPHPILCNVGG